MYLALATKLQDTLVKALALGNKLAPSTPVLDPIMNNKIITARYME